MEAYSGASMTSPPLVRLVPSVERGHGGEGGEGACEVVRDRHAGPHGRTIGIAGQIQQPTERDAESVQPGSGGVGPRLPEDADAHVDELLGEVVGAEVPAFHGAGAEVLAQHVRRCHQSLEELLALGLAEVTGDAAPAPTLDRPEQRVVLSVLHRHERADGAHEVALARQFDLDHVGAELAQQAGAERRRNPRPDVDDADAGQRPCGRAAHSGWPCSRSAMTSRMEPFSLRAASAFSAVAELCTQWWAMKWYLSASRLPIRVPVWLRLSLTV